VVDAGRVCRQDQRDRRDVPGIRLGCDPSGAVTATASAKPDGPVEDSDAAVSGAVGRAEGQRVVDIDRGRDRVDRLGDTDVEKIELLLNPAYVPSCNLNPIVSCGSVMTTPQGVGAGFPQLVDR